MYDVYGDLVVTTDQTNLSEILKKGYKKIFLRSAYKNIYRLFTTQWISPYPFKEFFTRYLIKEGGEFYYGDLQKVYFSPRYHHERISLKDYFKDKTYETLGVIGSGISPFTISLNPFFKQIEEYEPNIEAARFGRINKFFNNCKAITHLKPYDGKFFEVLISILPLKEWSFHLNYNFEKVCIFYCLVKQEELSGRLKELEGYYCCKASSTIARKYCKNTNIHRFTLEK